MVGVLTVDLVIRESRSLKDKRRVVKSITQRIRDRFNVSVAEMGDPDKHQRCTLQIASVCNESRPLHARFDKIVDVIRGKPDVSLLEYHREFY